MNIKCYYVADCSEQTIKSYTFDEFYDDVIFDFIGRNFDYFYNIAFDFLRLNPSSILAKNVMEVLSGESEPFGATRDWLITIAFMRNRHLINFILFSTDLEECQKWNQNIKVKTYLCD